MPYPGKGRADFYAPGEWNIVCYQCGRKRKSSQIVKNWQGFYVCPEHNEPRQPQDFVRSIPDVQTVPFAQPMPDYTFGSMCTPNGMSAVPGEAEPGCFTPGYLSPMYDADVTI